MKNSIFKRALVSVLAVVLMLNIVPVQTFAQGNGTDSPIVLYRNPVKDYAGDSISAGSFTEAFDIITKFYVRETTSENWKDEIISAAGVGGNDVYYHVETADLGYVSLTEPTWITLIALNAGYWFGWDAVKGGNTGTISNERKVKVVNVTGFLGNNVEELTGDLHVQVKGYVTPTFVVNGENITVDVLPLNSALTVPSDANKAIDDYVASKTGNGSTCTFLGWDVNGDGVYTTGEDAIIGKTVDVTSDDGCVAAEDVDGKTFTAIFETKHTVTWIDEDGTVLDKDENVLDGTLTSSIQPVNPTKAANAQYTYTFVDWNPVVDEKVTESKTYKAVYNTELNKYTVIWKNNGGTVLEEKEYEYGATPLYTGTPVAENQEAGKSYTFTGWKPSVTTVVGDVEYTAAYTTAEITYTVKFDTDGGTAVADATVGHGEVIAANTTTEKEGFGFQYWTLNGVEFDMSTPITENITLVAKWAEKVTVDFNTNGGSSVASQTIEVNNKITKPADPSKDGAVFDGWYADEACTTKFDFDVAVTENTTVYAKWLNEYTIIFNSMGGSVVDSQTVLENQSVVEPTAPTKAEYVFDGWYADRDCTVKFVFGTISINTTVYAGWKLIPMVMEVENSKVTVEYGTFTETDLLSLINPVVKVEGEDNVVVGAEGIDIIEDVESYDVGTYLVTLLYDRIEPVTETAEVTITQATGSVVVPSQSVKYGSETVVDTTQANCDTIKVVAGLDVHDETYLLGTVQVTMPEELLTVLALASAGLDIDMNDLSIEDLETLIKVAEGKDDTVDKIIKELKKYTDTIRTLVDTLKEIQAQLPIDSELRISVVSELAMPTNIGVYLLAAIGADANYTTDLDAGYIIIAANGLQTELTWNQTDENNIITLDKLTAFDLGATAVLNGSTVDGFTDASSAQAQNHVEYLIVGVDDNGELVIDRVEHAGDTLADAKAKLDYGAYAQIAYIANWDNVMYYAQPIARPFIITPNVADVDIIDANGNENYAQVYTYGEEIGLKVTVDGKEAPVDGLEVKYIGSDTTVDGWYRDEMPTDAGIYTVVAVYTQKDGETIVRAGGTTGILIINPADAEVGLEDAKYLYDGNEYFATLTNENLDYLTIAIDREDNIAYVNLPDDTQAHVERLVSMLPVELEEEVNALLGKYEDFDGDVQTSTLKSELTDLINKVVAVDVNSEVTAKAEEVAEQLINEIKENDDLKAIVDKLESELATIKDKISEEIPDNIETELVEYLKKYITVNEDSVEIDSEGAKADIKAKINELEGKLPEIVVDELYEMADEIINKLEATVDVESIKDKVSSIVSEINELDKADAEKLIKAAVGAAYGLIDEEEIKSIIDEAIAKVEAQGYVEYIETMVNNIVGIYGGDIDTTSLETALATLKDKVETAVKEGNISKDSLESLEKYVDDVLAAMIPVIEQIPDGTVVFGHNPSEIGVYDCYAINISANYKAEFVEAELEIYLNPIVAEIIVNKAVEEAEGSKEYDGGLDGFEFVLKYNGEEVKLITDEDGHASIEIEFGQEFIGESVDFELTETDLGAENMTYDNTVYKWTLDFVLENNGVVVYMSGADGGKVKLEDVELTCEYENIYNLEGEVIPTPDPEAPAPVLTPSSPDTSDGSNMMLWASLSIITLLAAIALVLMKKRQLAR